MKTFLFLLSIFFAHNIFGQAGSTVEIFPKNFQVFQRNDQDKANITYKGYIEDNTQTDFSVIVNRLDKPFLYTKQKLNFVNGRANFNYTFEIKAELAHYSAWVYIHKGKDSVLIRRALEFVCGETILLYGQSNIYADFDIKNYEPVYNPYVRTIATDLENQQITWLISEKWNAFISGTIGLELGKYITSTNKIPVAIINAAEGGKSLVELSQKDAVNPENRFTNYGQLLSKMRLAELTKQTRILIWRQGEREAFDSTLANNYDKQFDLLYKNWMSDLPAIKKIYNIQTNLLGVKSSKAGIIRDFQRRTKAIYPNIETLSSIGTVGYDGLHYTNAGYTQTAVELNRLIQRDFFGGKDVVEITPPEIKSASITTVGDTLKITFDEGQKLSYVSKVTNNEDGNLKTYLFKEMFFLDGKTVKTDSFHVKNNTIYCILKENSKAKKLTYMPDYWNKLDSKTNFPILQNSRGMKAFTFADFPIEQKVVFLPLGNEKNALQITVFPNPSNGKIAVEKIPNFEFKNVEIFTLNGKKLHELIFEEGSNKAEIELNQKGIFILSAKNNENQVIFKKFVIE